MLSRMRFKSFVWPHNPSRYRVYLARRQAVQTLPMGENVVQDLGAQCRIMEGEGAFFGEDAYKRFGELAALFEDGTPGILMHPVWPTSLAYLTRLELTQEPRADYVCYRFTFREAGLEASAGKRALPQAQRTVRIGEGDTVWALARRWDLSLDELAALNPGIGNFGRLTAGQEVRIG
ncbi:MAG: LysM peptidoglycan-binding domain-containing protein [Oscillospiraceae bacterium]|nr:LysM peptidoglycan-binding domain-containing protein [Oscillospiraceae bacterium]